MTTVLKTSVRVKNPMGLHTRPATHLVRLLYWKKDQVFFSYNENRVSGKSMLGLLQLAAPRNATIDVEVSGPNAQQTLEQVKNAFETGLGDISL